MYSTYVNDSSTLTVNLMAVGMLYIAEFCLNHFSVMGISGDDLLLL